MRHKWTAVFVAAVAALLAAGPAAAAESNYTVVDVGSQEELDWVDLNDNGDLTGQIGFPFARAAVRRANGSIVTFSAFAPYERAEATATNNHGTTVGFSAFQTMVGAAGAVWDATGTTVLGSLMLPLDVNDAGQVVGPRGGVGGGASFFWQAGDVRDLRFGASPTFVRAESVNENGAVVGTGQDLFGVWPLLWPPGATEALRLGRHQSSFSNAAVDVNDEGIAVGTLEFRTSPTRTAPVAVKWVGGVLQHLPTLSGVDGRFGRAVGINNRGEIVGTTEELVPTDVGQVAALWTDEGVVDLNTVADVPAGLVLVEAIDVNDRGQILALAHDPSTYPTSDCCGERFFLLTAEDCAPIEEDELASGDAGAGLPDGDGDGIPDCWEEDGIPVETDDGDLLLYELPGADPERKDLYVEVDHMAGFAPEPGSLEDVAGAFAGAPVGNPDGSTGITLHVEVDDLVPHVPGIGFAQGSPGPGALDDFWDVKSGGPAACDGFFGSGPERSHELCAAKLGAKRLVYRYALFGDTYTSADNQGSGIAECGTALTVGCAGTPGNDLLVTIGHHWDESDLAEVGGRRAMEAGAFMHELGHTLGLDHGGGDTVNCKPNYVSAMNYGYVLTPTATSAVRLLDYSHWASTLDEARLDESAGAGGPAGAIVFGWMGLWTAAPGGAIDWNRDGVIGSASANVNWIELLEPCRRPSGLPPSKVDGNGITLETLNFRASVYDESSVPAPTAFTVVVGRPAPGNSFDFELVTPARVEIEHGVVFLTLPVTVGPEDWVRARYALPEENPLSIRFEDGSAEPEDDNTEWNLENITHRRELLRGHDDWASLRYSVRDADGFADLAGRSAHPEPEITATEVRLVAEDILADLDSEPPKATAISAPAPNAAGWNRGPVALTITATDDGSGVKEIVYDLGSVPVTVSGATAQVTIGGDGVTTLTYFARDVRGNAGTPQTLVVRIDGTPPSVGCSARPAKLWPPNHKPVDVAVSVSVTDALSGPAGFTLVSATSNEPDDGLGDGDAAIDLQGWEPGVADVAGRLRAERAGQGNGRAYSLAYDARDVAGNVGTCTATILVPRNG